ncbi:glycosyltransferase [Bosea caraganae]|uniref:Glycosyltransferase n=2 Tax=Bosea caraganae TaxID=2763117 RepID=A0A370L999_9HYPH|nr:glycosyltransferase [Bosea caraganae]RDJ30866.1 glycosyltransferase [Bosea caraganae]
MALATALPPRSDIAKRDIGGVGIAALTREAALGLLDEAIGGRDHVKLAFCNAHLVNLAAGDAELRRALADFLILSDGIGVDIGSRLLYGESFPANLNGTDFIPALLTMQARPLQVMLLGGKPGVAERAAVRLAQDHKAHRFEVLGHGYFMPAEEPGLLLRLREARPDILLVAFGNPLQERWIAGKIDIRHASVAAGVGALFDFLAGEVERAPEAVRQMRLEWLYRLWLEPGRLWRRYVLGNPAFLLRMLRIRYFGRRSAR